MGFLHELIRTQTNRAIKQVQALTLCFTREALTIVQNLGLSGDERKSVASIITAIKRYIEGHINESVER